MLPCFVLPANLPQTIQDMPPKWAHLSLEISNFISTCLKLDVHKQSILLGVSGGVDSVGMLLIFKALQQKLKLRLEVAHLDHGLRPTSRQEAEWVFSLAQKLDLACHVKSMSLGANGQGLEEKGREARYVFFEQVRKRQGLDYLALAHNLNDLAEDQIMRLLRGCGWPELGGMPGFDLARKLLRPVLMQPRRILEQMLSELAMPHITDESNTSAKYTRNRVRSRVMPLLELENPGYLEHVKVLWKLAWIDRSYWNERLLCFPLKTQDKTIVLYLDDLNGLNEAVSMRLFRKCLGCLAELNGTVPFFTPANQLFEINQAVARRKLGQGSGVMRIQFPGGAVAVVERKEIIFRLAEA